MPGVATARRLTTAIALAVLVVGCGNYPPSPTEIVNDYLNALAEGNYASACAMLNPQARAALQTATGPRVPCNEVFARCLPNRSTILKQDQSQLFYANIDTSIQGSSADAKVSGTAVANALHEVTLEKGRSGWQLSSYGSGLKRCSSRQRQRQRQRQR